MLKKQCVYRLGLFFVLFSIISCGSNVDSEVSAKYRGTRSKGVQQSRSIQQPQYSPNNVIVIPRSNILSNTIETCDIIPNRTTEILNKYSKYFTQSSSSLQKEAVDMWSVLPDAYFNFIFKKHDPQKTFKIKLVLRTGVQDRGGFVVSVMGVDFKGRKYMYPESMQTEIFAFIHETGHAVHGYFINKLREEFDGLDFDHVLLEISEKTKAEYLEHAGESFLAYANEKDNEIENLPVVRSKEFLADLFSTWYCSQEQRDLLKEKMPAVYEFASKYFEKPISF